MRRGLFSIALVLALPATAAASSSSKPAFHDNCGTRAEKAKAVVFRAPGGPRLVGLQLGSGKTGIVLAHEFRANLCRWLPFARVLAKSGYRVLAFDFHNHGSSGFSNTASAANDRDVVAAGRLLLARGVQKLFVVGASMGGTASIVAASNLAPRLFGVISLSGPKQFDGADAAAAASGLAVPSLFVAASDDAPFADDARTLYDAVPRSDKQLEIVDGVAHGTTLLVGPSGAHVRSLVLAFLAQR
jgi:pimeloyl-ACP methyl ester carboxylesterase